MQINPLLRLHLSNIAVDATETEVSEMVSETLGIDKTLMVSSTFETRRTLSNSNEDDGGAEIPPKYVPD
ncbi:sugar transporter [Culex quinquefasciatus]|uniref:Sugar transporter n=1 Tax=Culex quinquefasciatus TaxID=7176 RepID=B0WF38_CULQU|nr:sugar transporter [Culex quinquefasciatus]|eukprot:XP_001847322.1 sugar transporter [Culex quinquefasciatus]